MASARVVVDPSGDDDEVRRNVSSQQTQYSQIVARKCACSQSPLLKESTDETFLYEMISQPPMRLEYLERYGKLQVRLT